MAAVQDFKLPSGQRVKLIFGQKTTGGYLTLLRASKTGKVSSAYESLVMQYNAMVNIWSLQFSACVDKECPIVDAVVSPPSSRRDAIPYLDAIKKNRFAEDLSGQFHRDNKVKAGDANTTVDDLIADFHFDAETLEHIKSILIVDDCLATGKTIDATLAHLRTKGLPADCEVTVAVWELIPQQPYPYEDDTKANVEAGGDAQA